MRRFFIVTIMLFLVTCGSLTSLALEKPQVSRTEAFVELPGERPCRVLLAEPQLELMVDLGTIVYFPIEQAQRAEDFAGLRPIVSWRAGEELAGPPRVEYRQMYDETGEVSLGYRYVVALPLLEATNHVAKALEGEIKIAKRSNIEAPTISFSIDIKSKEQETQKNVFTCNGPNSTADFAALEEWATLRFYDRAEFVVSTVGQPPIRIGCTIQPLTDFVERYPKAQMRFLCWDAAPVFNNVGTLTLFAKGGEFLYRITSEGLLDCSDSYSAQAKGFVIETRMLGEFVISDRALDPQEPLKPLPNPPVGARA